MKVLKFLGYTLISALAVLALVVFYYSQQTERDIAGFESRVTALSAAHPPILFDSAQLATLPAPVQRYFAYVFDGTPATYSNVVVEQTGQFRRPQTEGFNPTTARQVIAATTPALMFSAETPMIPGVWARAYDFFAEGKMEMKAKILSTLTVVDERETAELNRISLRRWLLESPLFPQALLPGGAVTWSPMDEQRALATVTADGMSARMIAHFNAQGQLVTMTATEDGELNTPYHGSGEHVARSDYRDVNGQMIPHGFRISRMAAGKVYPFWDGTVTEIRFE